MSEMKIRGKKCAVCGHDTGIANEQCPECDGTEFIDFEATTGGPSGDPTWVVTVMIDGDDHKEMLELHNDVLDRVSDFTTWYDGHDIEFIRVDDGRKGIQAGALTMYWLFRKPDGKSSVELVHALHDLVDIIDELTVEIQFEPGE